MDNSACVTLIVFIHAAGRDYASIDEVITFAIDDLVYEGSLLILDDEGVEELETTSLQIEALEGVFPVAVVNAVATVTITDDDGT